MKLLWQHNQSEPIGNIINITEDARGLYIVAQLLLDIQKAKDAYVMLKSGAIDSLSIGYTPIDYEIDYQTNIRTIKKVNLWEISLVTFPANENAKIISVKNESALEIEKMKLLYSAIDRAEKAVSALSF